MRIVCAPETEFRQPSSGRDLALLLASSRPARRRQARAGGTAQLMSAALSCLAVEVATTAVQPAPVRDVFGPRGAAMRCGARRRPRLVGPRQRSEQPRRRRINLEVRWRARARPQGFIPPRTVRAGLTLKLCVLLRSRRPGATVGGMSHSCPFSAVASSFDESLR